MDPTLSTILPWRRSVLPIENPLADSEILHSRNLDITIIDSGSVDHSLKIPLAGLLIVPRGREGDDLFCSLKGNIELLNSFFGVARLILISNPRVERGDYAIHPAENVRANFASAEDTLKGLLLPYYPAAALGQLNLREVRFLNCKEKLLFRKVRVDDIGQQVGGFTVTDELVETNGIKSLRRRLRLVNTHGWLHADVIVKPVDDDDSYIEDVPSFYDSLTMENMVDYGWMVGRASFPEGRHSAAMLHGLSLVSHLLNSNDNERRVLCLGVSDVLTTYALSSLLDFSVIGIDNDPVIFQALGNFESVGNNPISVGLFHYTDFLHELRVPGSKTGFEWDKMREKDWGNSGFDAIFIDINQPAPPSRSGICLCSPHRNFLSEDTLMAAKHVLRAHGVIVLHVVAPDYFFYVDTVKSLQQFVGKVYETRLSESEYVLVATRQDVDASTAKDATDDSFLKKLKDNLVPPFRFSELCLIS